MSLALVLAAAGLILLAAALYASVGHAGASGYLAVLALLGVAPASMRTAALALNLVVATIAWAKFRQAGHFSWDLFWPFAAASVPAAFVGGALALPGRWYRVVVGLLLLYAAVRMLPSPRALGERAAGRPPLGEALAAGLGIGFLSGLIGVGGGIFLSPLLLLRGWGGVRETAAVSAAFIGVNSAAGLLGGLSGGAAALPAALPLWAAAAAAGGWIGAGYGSRGLPTATLRRALALVLVIAGAKLILA